MHCMKTICFGSLPSEGRRILPPVGPRGRCQPFEGHAVDDVRDLAVAEFAVPFDGGAFGFFVDGVEVEAGGDDDRADRFDDQVVLLFEVNRAGAADFLADAAFAGFESWCSCHGR